MNFDQIVIREFLKLNPGFTDTPDLLAQKRVGNFFTGAVNFPRTEEATVTGGKVVKANVPDLANLFRNITPDIEIYKPTTNRDVAKVLFEKYGIVADVNDITPTAIVYDPLPLEVEIVASGKTITGKVKVKLTQKVMDLTEIITVNEVVGVVDKYPTAEQTKFVPIKFYYGADFTEWRDYLKTVSVIASGYGQPYWVVDKLLEIINDPRWESPVTWNSAHSSTAPPYSISDCFTPYNGPTSGYPEANPDFTHVLVINAHYSFGITPKTFLMHYDWRP